MAVGYNPRAITDGLVLSLDAGSPKNYNVGISTNWTDKVGGNNGTLVGGAHHNDGPFVDAGYVEFDGTDDYLTTATHASDFNFGTGDFTIEFWINSTQTSRVDPFAWNFFYTITGWGSFILNPESSSGRIDWYEGLGIKSSATSTGWNDGLWHHLAVGRSGTSLKMFLDGVQIGSTGTSSYSYGASDVGVSVGFSTSTGYYLNGQMSDVRVVKGTALYTSNFTPPTKQLTAIENTVLLTCQGNAITDASSNSLTITKQSSPTANLGSPASAFEFDGTDDYVQVPNSSALQLGTGDFTIEMWWYMIGSGNCRGFTLGDAYDANGMELYLGSSGTSLNVYIENATRITADSVPSFDTWHHYVIERTSGTMKLYIDGVVQTGTYSSSQSLGTGTDGDLRLGVEYYNGSLAFVGDCKISNFKIYKGKGFTASEVEQNFNALRGRFGI